MTKQKNHAMCGQKICPYCDKCTWCICRGDNACKKEQEQAPTVIFSDSRAYWRDMIRSN